MKHIHFVLLLSISLFYSEEVSAVIEITSVTHIAYDDYCNGSIDLTAEGNAGPFTFQWSNGATTEDIYPLCAGTYYVTVTNAFGCSKVLSAEILDCKNENIQPIQIYNYVITPISSPNASDGSINIFVSGGSALFFKWTKQGVDGVYATTQNLSNLPAGTYCVQITGDCFVGASACYTIRACSSIEWAITPTVIHDCDCSDCPYHICKGKCVDGSISLNVTYPPGPITYSWSTGSNNNNLTGLGAGNYSVTIYDKGSGCATTRSFTIETNEVVVEKPQNCYWTASCNGVQFQGYYGESYTAFAINEDGQCVYRQYCDEEIEYESPPTGSPQKEIDWDRCIGKLVCGSGPQKQVMQIIFGIEDVINSGENCIDQVECTIKWPDGTESAQNQIIQNYTFCSEIVGTIDENGNIESNCKTWKYCPELGYYESRIMVGIYGDDPGEEEEEEDCRDLPTCINPVIPPEATVDRRAQTPNLPFFSVFPNPSFDRVYVTYDNIEDETILLTILYDLLGNEILSQKNKIIESSGTVQFDITDQIPPGLYRVMVFGESKGLLHQAVIVHMNN